jgi:hypothetical protein
MRVQFQVSGGFGYFPGRAAPRAIDVDALPDADRDALKALVDAAGFFALPQRLPAPRGAADYQTNQITIEDGGRRHTVAAADPVANPSLQQLIEKLRALSRSSA